DAYTGDIFNEQADKLAGEGVNSESIFKINSDYIREQQCHFKWNGESIDTDIKSFIKKKEEVESLTTWFTQHYINKWLNKKIMEETNWKWSVQSWHSS
ncbi:3485_t:CDS:1, partial [Diversispora eburnea]